MTWNTLGGSLAIEFFYQHLLSITIPVVCRGHSENFLLVLSFKVGKWCCSVKFVSLTRQNIHVFRPFNWDERSLALVQWHFACYTYHEV